MRILNKNKHGYVIYMHNYTNLSYTNFEKNVDTNFA